MTQEEEEIAEVSRRQKAKKCDQKCTHHKEEWCDERLGHHGFHRCAECLK